jgi:vacuolar-type H+-ATPase subunit E/Vma4
VIKVANSSIYEKIENKGVEDAKEIYRIGQERAEGLQIKALSEAQIEVDQIIQKVLLRNNDKLKTKSTEIEQIAKQRSLSKKKEIIDKVFDLVHQKLNNLGESQLVDYVIKAILSDGLSGDETIMVAQDEYKKYLRLFSSKQDGALDKLNSLLKDRKYNLKLSNHYANIDGGFLVIGSKYDVDHSYKTILSNIKEQNESQVASMLFEEE